MAKYIWFYVRATRQQAVSTRAHEAPCVYRCVALLLVGVALGWPSLHQLTFYALPARFLGR